MNLLDLDVIDVFQNSYHQVYFGDKTKSGPKNVVYSYAIDQNAIVAIFWFDGQSVQNNEFFVFCSWLENEQQYTSAWFLKDFDCIDDIFSANNNFCQNFEKAYNGQLDNLSIFNKYNEKILSVTSTKCTRWGIRFEKSTVFSVCNDSLIDSDECIRLPKHVFYAFKKLFEHDVFSEKINSNVYLMSEIKNDNTPWVSLIVAQNKQNELRPIFKQAVAKIIENAFDVSECCLDGNNCAHWVSKPSAIFAWQ